MPDSEVSSSQTHFHRSHYAVKYLARGAYGCAYVAIKEEDVSTAFQAYSSHSSYPQLISDLRATLVVVKFYRGPRGSLADLRNEIDFLSYDGLKNTAAGTTLITSLIASHVDGSTQWLTLPYIRGGTIGAFITRNWKNLTLPLQWHIATETARALLFVHFGISNANLDLPAQWPTQTHRDFHPGNILVQPVSESSTHPGYPDTVLADFGLAARYTTEPATRAHATFNTAFLARQHDYRGLGDLMDAMFIAGKVGKANPQCKHCHCDACDGCPDAFCWECARQGREVLGTLSHEEGVFYTWATSMKGLNKNDGSDLVFVKTLVQMGRKKREELFVPMAEEVVEGLEKHVVSDETLLEATRLTRLV